MTPQGFNLVALNKKQQHDKSTIDELTLPLSCWPWRQNSEFTSLLQLAWVRLALSWASLKARRVSSSSSVRDLLLAAERWQLSQRPQTTVSRKSTCTYLHIKAQHFSCWSGAVYCRVFRRSMETWTHWCKHLQARLWALIWLCVQHAHKCNGKKCKGNAFFFNHQYYLKPDCFNLSSFNLQTEYIKVIHIDSSTYIKKYLLLIAL